MHTGGPGSEQRHFNSQAEGQDSLRQAIMIIVTKAMESKSKKQFHCGVRSDIPLQLFEDMCRLARRRQCKTQNSGLRSKEEKPCDPINQPSRCNTQEGLLSVAQTGDSDLLGGRAHRTANWASFL